MQSLHRWEWTTRVTTGLEYSMVRQVGHSDRNGAAIVLELIARD